MYYHSDMHFSKQDVQDVIKTRLFYILPYHASKTITLNQTRIPVRYCFLVLLFEKYNRSFIQLQQLCRSCYYKWKRCSKKKCCKQCGQVMFMVTFYQPRERTFDLPHQEPQ